jgi:pyruvate/2-oxoglutarate dehydrogenase complex dihydrolipoamide dehydrogenase (E3) component
MPHTCSDTIRGVTERYDLVVICSGPAGEKAAAQAAYHGRAEAND